jgi:hypothetical protein
MVTGRSFIKLMAFSRPLSDDFELPLPKGRRKKKVKYPRPKRSPRIRRPEVNALLTPLIKQR